MNLEQRVHSIQDFSDIFISKSENEWKELLSNLAVDNSLFLSLHISGEVDIRVFESLSNGVDEYIKDYFSESIYILLLFYVDEDENLILLKGRNSDEIEPHKYLWGEIKDFLNENSSLGLKYGASFLSDLLFLDGINEELHLINQEFLPPLERTISLNDFSQIVDKKYFILYHNAMDGFSNLNGYDSKEKCSEVFNEIIIHHDKHDSFGYVISFYFDEEKKQFVKLKEFENEF